MTDYQSIEQIEQAIQGFSELEEVLNQFNNGRGGLFLTIPEATNDTSELYQPFFNAFDQLLGFLECQYQEGRDLSLNICCSNYQFVQRGVLLLRQTVSFIMSFSFENVSVGLALAVLKSWSRHFKKILQITFTGSCDVEWSLSSFLNFDRLNIPVRFEKITFHKKVLIRFFSTDGILVFKDVTFKEDVLISDSCFNDGIAFINTAFERKKEFKNNTFGSFGLLMHDVIFHGDTEFYLHSGRVVDNILSETEIAWLLERLKHDPLEDLFPCKTTVPNNAMYLQRTAFLKRGVFYYHATPVSVFDNIKATTGEGLYFICTANHSHASTIKILMGLLRYFIYTANHSHVRTIQILMLVYFIYTANVPTLYFKNSIFPRETVHLEQWDMRHISIEGGNELTGFTFNKCIFLKETIFLGELVCKPMTWLLSFLSFFFRETYEALPFSIHRQYNTSEGFAKGSVVYSWLKAEAQQKGQTQLAHAFYFWETWFRLKDTKNPILQLYCQTSHFGLSVKKPLLWLLASSSYFMLFYSLLDGKLGGWDILALAALLICYLLYCWLTVLQEFGGLS
ncbi:MAG: hypothetical protein ACKO37_02540 [Vampirovibrionales bacterium]